MRSTSLTKWRRSGQAAFKRFSSLRAHPNRGRLGHQSEDAVRQSPVSAAGYDSLASGQHLAEYANTSCSPRSRVFVVLFQTSRQLLATTAGAWLWRASADVSNHVSWDKPLEKMDYWEQLRSFYRPNVHEVLHGGARQAHSEKSYATLTWRPAIVFSLTDNKGQVVLRSLGTIIGGALYFPYTSMPLAEKSQRRGALNSLSRKSRLSLAHPAVLLSKVVWSTLIVGFSFGFAGDLQQVTHTKTHSVCVTKTVESVCLALRAIYLLGLFMPCIILAPFAGALGGQVHVFWLDLLLSTLERAGPAFIKWGQWAATRPDVFPPDVCDILSRLHMHAPSHSFQQTRKICESAFRARLEDVFEEFSVDPIASGSIAQVHKAVLKNESPSRREPQYVAVKVRHPDVGRVIQQDFMIIKWLAYMSTVMPGLRHLHLDRTVQQFATFMTNQVDLTLEAAHLLRFIYNFRRVRNVTFPTPLYPWVHPSVLVETYEEGENITTLVDVTSDSTKSNAQLAYIGSSALLKMLLMDNFVHGDLHPGNIFVRFTGNRPNVILLDVGMTAELNQRNRNILVELFKAVAAKDGFRAAQLTLQFSKEQSCPDPQGFARDVDTKFKEYLAKRGTQFTAQCLNDLFDQVRKHRVNMDADVCTVMVTTLILEGWQRKLDPDLDIIKMVGELFFKQEWAIPYEYALTAIAAP